MQAGGKLGLCATYKCLFDSKLIEERRIECQWFKFMLISSLEQKSLEI